MLKTRGCYSVPSQTIPFKLDDLNSWYNGYSTFDDKKLFNPWSVIVALSTGELLNFWSRSGMWSFVPHVKNPSSVLTGQDNIMDMHIAHLLKHNNQFRLDMEALLMGESITISRQQVSYHQLVVPFGFMSR